ncbi:MAG: CRISPR-associated protein Cas4 [Bacteroidales bacterium]|nr:CRISPR-associated protein Cas4 [Bacteroidales bacterium]
MRITGTHINYYFICHRKLWLFANGFQNEQTSDAVYEGKLIHETSYPQRSEKYSEVEFEGIKIDYFDPVNKVVHEVKKSDKLESAHEWQLRYYLYVLEKNGIERATGILEYPKLHKTVEIFLSERDKEELDEILKKIEEIISMENCPALIKVKACRACAYFDFCFINEM